jgi:hypothetical protein
MNKSSTNRREQKRDHNDDDPVLRELRALKRLFAVFLMKAGSSHAEIAIALQIDRADVSRLLPARKFKPFTQRAQSNAAQ